MSKVIKAKLIIESLIFLGISTEEFSILKKKYGGLDGLYEFISDCLLVNSTLSKTNFHNK